MLVAVYLRQSKKRITGVYVKPIRSTGEIGTGRCGGRSRKRGRNIFREKNVEVVEKI